MPNIVLIGMILALALSRPSAGDPRPAADPLSQSSGNVVDCARLTGADAGQKIQACLDALPASGGIADARGLGGSQFIAHSLRLNKQGTILLFGSGVAFTFADGATLDLVASNVRVEGTGYTSVLRLGTGSAVRVGSSGHPLWGWRLERVLIEPAPGKRPQAGILLNNAREGILQELTVSGFSGSGIDVAENCWSERSIETRVMDNSIGYNFHGDKIAAWNIRGGQINRNRVGLAFDPGLGTVQGITITDGVQMEGNTDTAIRLGSGVIQGIALSNIYSEIFDSQRLIRAEAGSNVLKVNSLSISNAFVYSKNTPPVYLVTGPHDMVNATLTGMLLLHSQRDLPIAEASGMNTSVTVSESYSVSSSNALTEDLVRGSNGARTATIQGGPAVR